MNQSMIVAAALLAVGLSGCERTVVAPAPAPSVVPVPVPVPGPAGPPGAAGADGAPGEPGKSGSTVVIVPPEPAPTDAEKK